MSIKVTKTYGGVPISFWVVEAISRFDPTSEYAVISVLGFYNEAVFTSGGEGFKREEFLVKNAERKVENTRPATLEEKKELLPAALIADKTDKEIKAIAHDILLGTDIIPLPYFDDFKAKYEAGQWKEAAEEYLLSGADMIHGFFEGAVAA